MESLESRLGLIAGSLPAPPQSVLDGVKGIHPGLSIVRSHLKLWQTSGKPMRNPGTGECFVQPRYWVVLNDGERHVFLFPVQTPNGDFMPADGRIVARLGTDIGRVTQDPAKLDAMLEDIRRKKEEASKRKLADRKQAVLEENKYAWRDAVRNLEHGETRTQVRDERIFSYPGQTNRTSGRDSVQPDAKELGIILPGD